MWAKRMGGIYNMEFMQYCEINYEQQKMVMLGDNITLADTLGSHEFCVYMRHPENPNWTYFTQTAQLTLPSWASAAEPFIIRNYVKNTSKGRLIDALFAEDVMSDGVFRPCDADPALYPGNALAVARQMRDSGAAVHGPASLPRVVEQLAAEHALRVQSLRGAQSAVVGAGTAAPGVAAAGLPTPAVSAPAAGTTAAPGHAVSTLAAPGTQVQFIQPAVLASSVQTLEPPLSPFAVPVVMALLCLNAVLFTLRLGSNDAFFLLLAVLFVAMLHFAPSVLDMFEALRTLADERLFSLSSRFEYVHPVPAAS
eukprot:TRINITY_DN1109_c0_g1_i1.p1 TRINITY_DN1109_c0_g1~~TRINITY_DN1109_c0_g1_i1.p1  ORF type:complete len:310 (-),score=72.91 TRINITY_DN1109_c0_g1_i1:12-941(-)